ncbi:MAG: type VI secretion system tube protein Hcp [Saprospiraceae bacterium]|nr:type VI secretion system tube protein Hcp [Saprospiraceae bacterium]
MKNKIYVLMMFLSIFITSEIIAQSESIRITQEGLQYNDGTEQVSASLSNHPGSSYNWFVYIEYSNDIEGDVTSPAYEGHSFALRVHHELYRELNTNGSPQSDQHHRALVLKKDIDKASTNLYNAFNNNAVIDQIKIKFVRTIQDGTSPEKFRITLNNVKISEIKNDLSFDQETGFFKGVESLRLVYQSMAVQHFTPNNTVTLNYQY